MFLVIIICNFFIPSADLKNADFSKFIPEDYNKDLNPKSLTEVEVTITVIKVIEISTITLEMTAEVSLLASWTDDRLNWTNISELKSGFLPHTVAKKLWFPKLLFYNCKGCGKYLFSADVNEFYFIKKTKKIVIELSQVRRKFGCIFNLQYYPFDTPHCTISLRTFDSKVRIELKARSEFSDSELASNHIHTPPDFHLTKFMPVNSNYTELILQQKIINIYLNYVLHFRRVSQKFIFVIFIPSMLIVIISWLSFWLELNATAPRVSLGLTVILTLITHISSIQKSLPNVDTMTAVDVWMSFCLFNVFFSLIEVAMVNFCHHNCDTKKVSTCNGICTRRNTYHVNQGHVHKDKQKMMEHFSTAKKIDSISRIVFPLFFVSFNIFFWWYYFF